MYAGRRILSLLLVLVILGSVVSPAVAVTETTDEILLKRVVVASMDEKGKLLLNVTWINRTINLGNVSCANGSCCSCENDTCSALYSVDVDEVYNASEKNESLKLLNVTVYNESFSYTMYVLVYKAERGNYNFTLVTRILINPETGGYELFLTGANIAPVDVKALPVGDIILTAENLTLSEYYWTLSRVLMELRKNDDTQWIWGHVAKELKHLSQLVKKELPEYDQEKAQSLSIISDLDTGVLLTCGFGCLGCAGVIASLLACIASGPGVVACFTALGLGYSTTGGVLIAVGTCGTCAACVLDLLGYI